MIELIRPYDTAATIFLHHLFPHSPPFTMFFSFFSLLGGSIFVWALISILIIVLEEIRNPGIQRKDRQFSISFFLVGALAFSMVEYVFKPLFQRIRPVYDEAFLTGTMITVCPHDYSFPSGHSTLAFAYATVLSRFDPKRTLLYYAISSLVAFSRIYLGCHFLGDVLIGALLGVCISTCVLFITYRKNGDKYKYTTQK